MDDPIKHKGPMVEAEEVDEHGPIMSREEHLFVAPDIIENIYNLFTLIWFMFF